MQTNSLSLEDLQPLVRAIAGRQAYVSRGKLHVDDLTQVGMLAVHTVLLQAGAADEDRIRTHAGVAARNAMIDLARIETRCGGRGGDAAKAIRNTETLTEVHAETIPDEAPGPDEVLLKRQMAMLLTEAVSSLPRRQQDVLRLTYEAEATQAEMAAQWGISAARVCQLHGEALSHLRKILMPAPPAPTPAAPPPGDVFASDIVRGVTPRLLATELEG